MQLACESGIRVEIKQNASGFIEHAAEDESQQIRHILRDTTGRRGDPVCGH